MVPGTTILLLCLATPFGTWSVDDDGPADFAGIDEAIAAVAPGDVLLVEPGTYAAFHLDKRLTILGRAGGSRPHVQGLVRIDSPGGFTLAGFDLDWLLVQGVAGRGRIDDCTINVVTDVGQTFAASFIDCDQVVVSRTEVQGSKGLLHDVLAGTGVHLAGSRVALVDCTVEGGEGYDDGLGWGGDGGAAVEVLADSRLVAAGCPLIRGGRGGIGYLFCSDCDGDGGDGLVVSESTAVIRGKSSDSVIGGFGDPTFGGVSGKSIVATNSVVVVSGSYHGPVSASGSMLLQPALDEPFLENDGEDVPGGAHAVRLHGPDGAPALLLASLAPALLQPGGYEGALWLDPGVPPLVLVPVTTTGGSPPVGFELSMPPAGSGLEGLALELQAAFPTLPGAVDPAKKLFTNPAQLIVRF